jgi:hypothetical protein
MSLGAAKRDSQPEDSQETAQRFLLLFPVAATQNQLGAIAQTYCVVAVKKRRELSHPIQIDDCGTMDTQEFPRVQSFLNRGHRAAQQVRFWANRIAEDCSRYYCSFAYCA